MKQNIIHETAIIDEDVILGEGNYIGPWCILKNCKIGNNNRFEAYCSIGTPPEHKNFFDEKGKGVIIGNDCTFREFITINSGTKVETVVGDSVVMLKGSHIGHDSQVEDFCNISCNCMVGGHSYLMEGCNLGLGTLIHQYSIIGAYSMVGMGSLVLKDSEVSPGNTYVGSPVRYLKPNTIGLQRYDVSTEDLVKFYMDWITFSGIKK